jgi:hypothetical protein
MPEAAACRHTEKVDNRYQQRQRYASPQAEELQVNNFEVLDRKNERNYCEQRYHGKVDPTC